MKITQSVTGVGATSAMLSRIESQQLSIAKAAVSAGLNVMARAVRDASPGTIKQETGRYMRVSGGKVTGRAGLMRFPRKGDGQDGPHGVYVDQGTKYITPRRFAAAALRASESRAKAAAVAAVKRRIEKLTTQK